MAFTFGSRPFGTPQQPPANTGGGLFGSQTPPAFGASSTPSLFGGSTFGANPSPSPFGAASGSSLFGTPQPSSSAASTGFSFAPPSSSPGLFGFSTTGSSLFGGSTAPSLFSNPASASTPSSSPYGSIFAPAASSAPAFGAQPQPQQQPQQQSLFGTPPGLPPQSTDAAVREVLELKAAYTPSSPNYKFKYLFLNVVDNPAQRVKPSGVDEMRWRQAMAAAGGPDNPDRLWPVLATGFKDLLARSAAQSAALEENSQRLKSLNDIAHNLARKHATELKQRSNDVQKRHIELSHRLLHSYRNLDALESRLAASIGYKGDVARARKQSMSKGLAGAEAEVSPVSSTSLPRRLEGMAAAVRTHAGAAVSAGSGAGQGRLDERSAAQLMVVLRDHAIAVSKLQNVLKQDALDVAIMAKERQAGIRMLE